LEGVAMGGDETVVGAMVGDDMQGDKTPRRDGGCNGRKGDGRTSLGRGSRRILFVGCHRNTGGWRAPFTKQEGFPVFFT
jgi:hypothetical protein